MTESNNNEILNEKSEIKSTKKEKKISSKIDSEKNIGSSIIKIHQKRKKNLFKN